MVFAVLMLISLGSRFTGYLQDAAAGDLAADALWLIVALRLPDFIQLVTPFSLFLAILLLIGRLGADAEMPIFQMAEVGPGRMFVWLSTFIVPATLIVAYMSFSLTPDARNRFLDLLSSQEIVSEFDVIKEGTFRTFDDGKRVSYMNSVNREAMTIGGVFLHQQSPTMDVAVLADQGRYHIDPDTGMRYLELNQGHRYVSNNENQTHSVLSFDSLTQRVEAGSVNLRLDDPTRVPTGELDSADPVQRMEWHWRLAMPLMTLIAAICAIGLGRVKPRSGRFGKILPGLLYFIAYYGLVLTAMNQFQGDPTLAAIGLWPIHMLMGAVAVYFLHKNWRPI